MTGPADQDTAMPAQDGIKPVAGVMGWPINHSRSPKLHGHWLKRYGIDGAYVPLAVPPTGLPCALASLAVFGFRGCNVTVPHKEAALAAMDTVDAAAQRIGAVAAVVGAGGAARAIVAALIDAGAPEVRLTNRTLGRAEDVADAIGGPVTVVPWDDRAAMLDGVAVAVNTTTLGMSGQPPLDLPLETLPTAAVVTDIVYTPLETPLLSAARARGNPVVDGLGMLLHQARPGFEAWFGVAPTVDDALRAAVLADA